MSGTGEAPSGGSGRIPGLALRLARRSMSTIEARDREGWLSLFAEESVVEDPVGPSALDPEGRGHRGRDAIARFYDNVIAPARSIRFEIDRSIECGDEVANVGRIFIDFDGSDTMVVEGVFCYKARPDGKLQSLRAFWDASSLA
jgi:steroid delta-isomerase